MNLIYVLKHNAGHQFIFNIGDICLQLLKNNCDVIFCLDNLDKQRNNNHDEKKHQTKNEGYFTIVKYGKKRRLTENAKVKITSQDIDDVKQFCEFCNIPVIMSSDKADPLCTKFIREDKCDVVLSKDMDFLAFGCKYVVQVIQGKIVEFSLDHILKQLKITYEEFVDICVLMGSCYSNHVPPFYNCKSLLEEDKAIPDSCKVFYIIVRLIKQYKSLDNLFTMYKKPCVLWGTQYSEDNDILAQTITSCVDQLSHYIRARNMYLKYPNEIEYPEECKYINENLPVYINIKKLIRFFNEFKCQNHVLMGVIKNIVNEINSSYIVNTKFTGPLLNIDLRKYGEHIIQRVDVIT